MMNAQDLYLFLAALPEEFRSQLPVDVEVNGITEDLNHTFVAGRRLYLCNSSETEDDVR